MKHKYLILSIFASGLLLTSIFYFNRLPPQNVEEKSKINIGNIPEKVFYTDKVFSDLTPKTNSWISSAFFKKDSEPLFVYPYTLDFTETGFTIGIPEISFTPKTIFGSHNPNTSFSFGTDLETHVIQYGDIDATLELRKPNGNAVAQVKLIRGVPYVYVTIVNNTKLSIEGNNIKQDSAVVQIDELFRVYNLNNVSIPEAKILRSNLVKGNTFVIGAISVDKNISKLDQHANTIISNVNVKKAVLEDYVTTDYVFSTLDNKPILFSQLYSKEPQNSTATPTSLQYKTIKGNQTMYLGNTFQFQRDLYKPISNIDPSQYTEDEKNKIKSALLDDLLVTSFKEDSYYGGKTMARQAYLYEIARDFGWNDITEQIINPLRQELGNWFTDNGDRSKFVYEPNIKTIVGIPPSFGSELANDHHFHYGYIIYAAAVVSEYDKEFFNTHKDKISLVLADYASTDTSNEVFPYLRNFDQYELHSWASGFALFQDGNNKESTSEAVNSWYAMYRWAKVTEDKEIENMSLWLYSQEINTTFDLWLNPVDIITSPAYTSPIISIVWGGKLDYYTWFSDTDEAKFGIQLLPLNFATRYLQQNTDLIKSHINYIKSKSSTGEYTQFKDILLTYESTINPDVISKIQNISSKNFDDGNSKAASLVWAFQFN